MRDKIKALIEGLKVIKEKEGEKEGPRRKGRRNVSITLLLPGTLMLFACAITAEEQTAISQRYLTR